MYPERLNLSVHWSISNSRYQLELQYLTFVSKMLIKYWCEFRDMVSQKRVQLTGKENSVDKPDFTKCNNHKIDLTKIKIQRK
jgi:hypothetical protein